SRVLGYLKKTSALQLTYTSYPGVLEGYSDASWINHSGDSKSTSGWIYTLPRGAISWVSKKQTCISHSTMEAEFIALAAAGKEAEWIRDLLMDIRLWPGLMPLIPMYCDSKAALSIAYNYVYNGKSRHLSLRHNYVRQLVDNGNINVVYVKSPGKGEVGRFVNQTSSIFSMTLGKRELTTSFRFLSTAIALQTSVVAAQGLHVWTVYILRASLRKLLIKKNKGKNKISTFVLLKKTWLAQLQLLTLRMDDSEFSVFTPTPEDVEGTPLYNRFVKTDRMKAVPPPLSGNYIPLSDPTDLDESQMTYGPKQTHTSDSEPKTSDLDSCESNSSVESLESMPNQLYIETQD
ncbi:hypothetical protein Tco_0912623, partial [Tanacetum coccineum]